MGGMSSEREVSLRSGKAVAEALVRLGHETTSVDVHDEALEDIGPERFDVAFLALHGGFGEDGRAQRILATRGLPYTGSGPEASALAMDKWAARQALSRAGVAVADGVLILTSTPTREASARMAPLGWPVVMKPRHGGSSVGVTILDSEEGLPEALQAAGREEAEAVVERFIPGREMTVGILGERALPPVEMLTPRGFYDYEAKYQAQDTRYQVDPDMDATARERLQESALRAFRALGCRGMARVDFRLPPDGDPVALELNTIPGLTERSLLPKAAAKAGIPFDSMCTALLEGALASAKAHTGQGGRT